MTTTQSRKSWKTAHLQGECNSLQTVQRENVGTDKGVEIIKKKRCPMSNNLKWAPSDASYTSVLQSSPKMEGRLVSRLCHLEGGVRAPFLMPLVELCTLHSLACLGCWPTSRCKLYCYYLAMKHDFFLSALGRIDWLPRDKTWLFFFSLILFSSSFIADNAAGRC